MSHHDDKMTFAEASRSFTEQDVLETPIAELKYSNFPSSSHHCHMTSPRTGGGRGSMPGPLSSEHTVVEKRSTPLDEEAPFVNHWYSTRKCLAPYMAEFLGTFVLVLWGEATQAQVVASRGASDWISIAWGWGVGFMLALYVSAGISGGHINPAVTLSLAIFRKFEWRKVPGYFLSQFFGAFVGVASVYGIYYWPLHATSGGPASILVPGPASILPNASSAFFATFVGAALLMGAICALTDKGNNPLSPGLTPLLLGLTMVGLATSFGFLTGFPLNPARDLAPRILVWIAHDASGADLWFANYAFGIWIPTLATVTGALTGNFVYDVCCYEGKDSPLNANFYRAPVDHVRSADMELGRSTQSVGYGYQEKGRY